MNADHIANRLRDAIETLHYSIAWLDGDPDAIADIDSVVCDLSELKRELEMVPFRSQVPA